MNAHGVLDPTLKAILDVIKPLREDYMVRAKIIEELQDVVKSVESLRGATVEPFGSFVSNLFTRWGDLDISIMVSNGSCISSAGKKRKQNLLDDLLQAIRQKGGRHRLQCIRNARVPILKFESEHQRISCDISIDNLQGQIKSTFLFWINEIDGRFRDVVLLVKEWAKTHNINNPKTGSLNSYSLSLLVIFHFQTCVPPVLPPLKDIYPRNLVDDLRGMRTEAEMQINEICSANIQQYRSDSARAVNRSSVPELFVSFLAKFSDISLKAKELGICPFSGRWETISSNTRWLPRTYALFIEDPFEQPENSARAVSAGNLQKISQAFQTTFRRLVSPNRNQITLHNELVRPQISQFITGLIPPLGNSSHSTALNITTRQQRTAYSEPQVQRQSYSRRSRHNHPNKAAMQAKESRPSNWIERRQEGHGNDASKQRPVQQYRSPRQQQVWRPKSDA